jgi:hypothetical protein
VAGGSAHQEDRREQMKQRLSPDERLRISREQLSEIENKLEQRGLPVSLLQEWLRATQWYGHLLDKQVRGELTAIEYDPDDE